MKDTQTQMSAVIEAKNLNLVFGTADGPVQALKDVNLTVNQGDFVSFIGPSGCGKTTFLRAIAALEAPTGGTLTVNGMTPDEARRKRAYGYVFQASGLYPWRTIAGNIRLPLEIMGFERAEQEARVERVLELVELTGFGKKFPWQVIDAGLTPDDLVVFKYEDEGVATLEGGLYVMEEKLADPAFEDKMVRFVRASMQGWKWAEANPDAAAMIVLENDETGAQTEVHQKRMMAEIAKLTAGSNGALVEADYERTVAALMSGGSDPVISAAPVGAWTHQISDKALQ